MEGIPLSQTITSSYIHCIYTLLPEHGLTVTLTTTELGSGIFSRDGHASN